MQIWQTSTLFEDSLIFIYDYMVVSGNMESIFKWLDKKRRQNWCTCISPEVVISRKKLYFVLSIFPVIELFLEQRNCIFLTSNSFAFPKSEIWSIVFFLLYLATSGIFGFEVSTKKKIQDLSNFIFKYYFIYHLMTKK